MTYIYIYIYIYTYIYIYIYNTYKLSIALIKLKNHERAIKNEI